MADYNVFNKLSELLAQYGWTAEEALENLDKATKALANYYIMGNDAVKDVISDINNLIVDLRPKTDAETENPNQKSDLEIFTPICSNRDKPIIITAENSQFDKDLLSKHFNINIEDEDDWIREALYGEIEI